MSKRHFISTLIRAQHYIVLIGLLTLIVGSQHVSAQSPLAQDAYAIFEASCLICHGPDGAYRETLLMEHSELIDGGTVVPGNPNASELYKRLLGTTENGAQMPFGQPLPAQSIDTIRRWILAGAPDWTVTPQPITALSLPLNFSRTLKITSCHSNRSTAPLPATLHLLTSTTQGKHRRYLVSTERRSPNWSTASHGGLQSPTQAPLTRKLPSSTSTCDTTSGIALTAGRR